MKFRTLSLLGASCWVATAGIGYAELLTHLTAQQKELLRHAYEERVTQDSYVSGHEVDLASLQDLVVAEPKKGKGTKPKKETPSTLQYAKALYEDLGAEFEDEYVATYQEKVSLPGGEEVAALTFLLETTLPSKIRGLKNKETKLWVFPKLLANPSSEFSLHCKGKEEYAVVEANVQIRKGLSCRSFTSVADYQEEKDGEVMDILEKVSIKLYPENKKLKQLTSDHLEALRVQYEAAFDASQTPFSIKLFDVTIPLAKDRYKALVEEGSKSCAPRSLRAWVDYAGVSDHLVKSEVISHRVTKSAHLRERPDVYFTQWIFPVSHNPGEHYLVCTSHTTYSGSEPTACSVFIRNQDRSFPREFE